MDTAVTFRLEHFEGPLELLLYLISKHKVDIADIPVAMILEQYLDALGQMRAMDMEITADFIVMAAQLIYIKSRLLLPAPPQEPAEDPRAALAESLLEYRRHKAGAAFLATRMERGFDRIVKPPEPLSNIRLQAGRLEYRHTPADLLRALRLLRERGRRTAAPTAAHFAGIVDEKPVSVEAKVSELMSLLSRRAGISLSELYGTARSRSELVALFLAVLELWNDRRIATPEDGPPDTLSLRPRSDA